MAYPNVWKLQHLIQSTNEVHTNVPGTDKWVPARPLGMMSFWSRFRPAWLVFTGKADAVIWPANQ